MKDYSTGTLADGTYRYYRTNHYGPSTLTTLILEDGVLTSYVLGEDGDTLSFSGADLAAREEVALNCLRYELEWRGRNKTLFVQVAFTPLPEVVEPVISLSAALALHAELDTLGYSRCQQYSFASYLLRREVTSFAELTVDTRTEVREYAYGQLGLLVGGWVA